jgi:hypothetical protein
MAKGGLFSAPAPADDDADDYSDDALPALDDEDAGDEPAASVGPFESYCETIFDEKSDYQAKCDALREAIMTLIEEGGSGPLPPLPGLDDL